MPESIAMAEQAEQQAAAPDGVPESIAEAIVKFRHGNGQEYEATVRELQEDGKCPVASRMAAEAIIATAEEQALADELAAMGRDKRVAEEAVKPSAQATKETDQRVKKSHDEYLPTSQRSIADPEPATIKAEEVLSQIEYRNLIDRQLERATLQHQVRVEEAEVRSGSLEPFENVKAPIPVRHQSPRALSHDRIMKAAFQDTDVSAHEFIKEKTDNRLPKISDDLAEKEIVVAAEPLNVKAAQETVLRIERNEITQNRTNISEDLTVDPISDKVQPVESPVGPALETSDEYIQVEPRDEPLTNEIFETDETVGPDKSDGVSIAMADFFDETEPLERPIEEYQPNVEMLPELPASVEKVDEVITELAEVLQVPESEMSVQVHQLLEAIISLSDITETNIETAVTDEDDIERAQQLETLFTELFETAGIEYTPELVTSFVRLTKARYFNALLVTEPVRMERSPSVDESLSQDLFGAREFLQKLQHGLHRIRLSVIRYFEIGRSVLRSYGSAAYFSTKVNA